MESPLYFIMKNYRKIKNIKMSANQIYDSGVGYVWRRY